MLIFAKAEGAGDVFEGHGVVSKLKKTQDIIKAKLRGPRHGRSAPFRERREYPERDIF
jgi:hypothetical protein